MNVLQGLQITARHIWFNRRPRVHINILRKDNPEFFIALIEISFHVPRIIPHSIICFRCLRSLLIYSKYLSAHCAYGIYDLNYFQQKQLKTLHTCETSASALFHIRRREVSNSRRHGRKDLISATFRHGTQHKRKP